MGETHRTLNLTEPEKLGDQIGNTYVSNEDRFVVSLVVGYAVPDAATPQEAARAALDLTRDEGSTDTHWYVFDRKTGQLHLLEQDQFEDIHESTE